MNAWSNSSSTSKVIPMSNEALRHEDVWWNACVAPRILNLCTRWRRVVSLPFYSREKSPWYALNDRRLGRPQRRYGPRAEEKNLLPVPGIEAWFFSCPACSLVAALTKLPRIFAVYDRNEVFVSVSE
jgi:hypothetical protein